MNIIIAIVLIVLLVSKLGFFWAAITDVKQVYQRHGREAGFKRLIGWVTGLFSVDVLIYHLVTS